MWFRTVFCLTGFIQKEMHKNVLENSGHDSSDTLHCLDTFVECIYTQICVIFSNEQFKGLSNSSIL